MRQLTFTGPVEALERLCGALQISGALVVPDGPRRCPCRGVFCTASLVDLWGWIPDGMDKPTADRAGLQMDQMMGQVADRLGCEFIGGSEYRGDLETLARGREARDPGA